MQEQGLKGGNDARWDAPPELVYETHRRADVLRRERKGTREWAEGWVASLTKKGACTFAGRNERVNAASASGRRWMDGTSYTYQDT